MTTRIQGSPGAELPPLPPPKPSGTRPAPVAPGEPSGFQKALGALGRQIDHGETMVNRALGAARHRALSPGDLISLQAGIYRYSEAVDLAAKLVDRAGSAVRTTLQSGNG